MRIAILGPLEVTADGGGALPVAGARLRSLLIRLALDAGRTVGVDALTDAVWATDPPAGAANALQTLVSRLRRGLPAGAIGADAVGYRVVADVDVDEFDAHVRTARAAAVDGDLAAADAHYDTALAVWRGEPLVDVADADFARAPIARLSEARIAATEERLAVGLSLRGGSAVVAALEELTAAQPLRERPHRLLITALADVGRAGDAVTAYTTFRDRLANDLGLDPSPEFTAAYAAMLRGDRISVAARPESATPAAPPEPAAAAAGSATPATGSAAAAQAASATWPEPARPDFEGGNLRPSLTSFVGRAVDLDRLVVSIRDNRLVTIVGSGGAGKTRLAVEAGHKLNGAFADGVWLVELASVRTSARSDLASHAVAVPRGIGLGDDVPRAITEALNPREHRFLDERARPLERLLDALARKDLLLILDNCEHLIDACAGVVEELLTRCPGVRIVITSREPLGIPSEMLNPLGPLATPSAGASPEQIADAASVRLFADRAAAVRPGFTISAGTDTATVEAVAEICRRLDGMPLAIELACARLRSMPVDQIASRLDDRFRLLTGGSRTALPRHQTLAAVVEWSWDLLDAVERDLAMRFAVFAGGATLDIVMDLCGADSVGPLAGLVDKSFVVLGDDARYRMLETIRAYAAERLADSSTADVVRKAHAEFFTDLAERADGRLRGRGQQRALRQFRAERDNFAAALQWAVETDDGVTAVRLAGALAWYWTMSDYHADALTWLGQALALPGNVPPDVRARALAMYGMNVAVVTPDVDGVAAVDEAAALAPNDPIVVLSQVLTGVLPIRRDAALHVLPIALEHRDPWVRAMGRTIRGILNMYAAAPDEAERDLMEGLAGFEALGDDWARAMLGGALGELRAIRGDTDGAVAALQRSASIAESLGVDEVAAQSFLQLSLIRARRGDLDGAEAEVARARAIAEGSDSSALVVGIGVSESEILRRRGDLHAARERYLETLGQVVDFRSVPREMHAGLLAGLMVTEVQRGDAAAVRRTGAELLAQTVREHIVVVMATLAFAAAVCDVDPARSAYLVGVADAMRGMVERGNPDVASIESTARGRLGNDGYAEAYGRGAAIDSIDAAIDALTAAAATLDAAASGAAADADGQAMRR